MSIVVKSIDVTQVKIDLKSCPKNVQEYVRAIEHALTRQVELTNKCISKLREQTP